MLRLPLLIVLAAFGANAGSHCFCRIAKSDCGDCNPSCIAQDFGAVASFGTFQLHTDAICTQACDDKLAGIAQDAACSDLAVNLKVPLPWNGEVQSCWHVGTDAPSASGRRQLTCAAPPPPSSYPPAGEWRRITFYDDFRGKPAGASPALADCYDRAPTCVGMYTTGPEACPPEAAARLKDLNKCVWSVLAKASWLSPSLASFDARELQFNRSGEGGLSLTAHAIHPDGSPFGPPAQHMESNGQLESDRAAAKRSSWEAGYDCLWVFDPWNGIHYKCPFMTGGIISQPLAAQAGPAGFAQQYGRFEIRARLPYGHGSFPSFWMLPASGPWPEAGELDVFEENELGEYMFQTLHAGVCAPSLKADLDGDACHAAGGTRWHEQKNGGHTYPSSLSDQTPFWRGFHLFAVDWDKATLRFSVDGVVQNTIQDLDFIESESMDLPHHWWNQRKWKSQMPAHIPDRPFFLLLEMALSGDPNPADFVPPALAVDFVRASQRCLTREDFCPQGGELDPASSRCVPAGPGRPATYPTPCAKQ
jgi:hypothetical protein